MRELIKQYIDKGISRRDLTRGLTAAGLSAAAAKAMAQSLAPPAAAQTAPAQPKISEMRGTGGALFVQQLKAAGVEYIFFNPSTADSPVFDALVNESSIQLIKGVQEGAVVAMADGYARASGKLGVVIVANVGLPNAATQMVNSFKDQTPILVVAASVAQENLGREALQEYENIERVTQPMTKWHWVASATSGIAETTRRAVKFATTQPSGPVYLSIPENLLRTEATAQIFDKSLFEVSMRMRPDKADIDAAAKMIIEAKNPLMSIGDEIYQCGAEKEVLELAELLGLPTAGQGGTGALGFWTKPFPSRHPLYLGPLLREMRFPGAVDVHLNIGSKYGEQFMPGAKQISIRRDPTSLARVAPVDLGMIADIRLATADLIESVKSQATAARLKQIAGERLARTSEYTAKLGRLLDRVIKETPYDGDITMERLGIELEASLERDTIYVNDVDSGKRMDIFMRWGPDDKQYIGTGPNVLGWGMAAALGVKLAKPDRPVLSVVGDGSFLFSGPQPLWSISRYQAPLTVIVLNNRSYNNERNRIWMSGGTQFQSGRDMTCYLGSPDVDYAKTSQAFGVDAEIVKDPRQIQAAVRRARNANAEGRPYLLDVNVARNGIGNTSTWHPAYSLAAKRTRRV